MFARRLRSLSADDLRLPGTAPPHSRLLQRRLRAWGVRLPACVTAGQCCTALVWERTSAQRTARPGTVVVATASRSSELGHANSAPQRVPTWLYMRIRATYVYAYMCVNGDRSVGRLSRIGSSAVLAVFRAGYLRRSTGHAYGWTASGILEGPLRPQSDATRTA
ncbi:hypothetical protein GGS23DRAFT_197579 [Durotheca rogersii]|uniref:uncharacterized protein n=1 Tax=Durotheca rogersii TaxID=419775 RepID=UPI00221EFB56|nr:uncharacterized protein GGS23DRAFT_197579 [Durotheca rogersii]KAI5867813.1 hypothetical protein GGS23DRAFT_197579 [Durotheca rogersii]